MLGIRSAFGKNPVSGGAGLSRDMPVPKLGIIISNRMPGQVMRKVKKSFVIAIASKQNAMAKLSKPKPSEVTKGELVGKIVRVVTDTSQLCGQLVEVSGQAAGKIVGQTVFRESLKEFVSDKAVRNVSIDEKLVLDVEKIEVPDPKL